jgi:hypothetical protein
LAARHRKPTGRGSREINLLAEEIVWPGGGDTHGDKIAAPRSASEEHKPVDLGRVAKRPPHQFKAARRDRLIRGPVDQHL